MVNDAPKHCSDFHERAKYLDFREMTLKGGNTVCTQFHK